MVRPAGRGNTPVSALPGGDGQEKERTMAGRRHVVPNPSGGWDVKAQRAGQASSHHETQAAAIAVGRRILRNAGGGEVVIHGRDGKVRQADTIAPDG